MKQCPGCGEIKPLDAFYTNPGGRDGRRPECKQCTSRLRMERYRANREAEIARVTKWQRQNAGRIEAYQARYRQLRRSDDRAGHLRRKFGLTLDEYDAMLGAQHGRCAICGREPRPGKHLHVDHDHDTGRVRGLLCFSCNVAIGNLHHDVDKVMSAADYVDDDGTRRELTELARERAHGLVQTGLV